MNHEKMLNRQGRYCCCGCTYMSPARRKKNRSKSKQSFQKELRLELN